MSGGEFPYIGRMGFIRKWLPGKRALVAGVCLLVAGPLLAVDRVTVIGLFRDKAVLDIDGVQRYLRSGQRSPEGVRLISASAREAILEINGEQVVQKLGVARRGFKAPAQRMVQISKDQMGMFATTGSINGQLVDFVVDTGATVVAMNADHARKLGLSRSNNSPSGNVNTAGGAVPAYGLKLDRVQVGEITVHNVDAVVIQGNPLPSILLGMSFLSQVEMQHQGNLMILKQNN